MLSPTSSDWCGKGARHLQGLHCEITVCRPAPSVVVLTIRGHDIGEFGETPMLEIERYLRDDEPIDLFIDARKAVASIDVSGDWARWLDRHRLACRSITMLAGSRLVEVTAEFVRSFSDLKGIMTIVSDPAAFDRRLAASTAQQEGGPTA